MKQNDYRTEFSTFQSLTEIRMRKDKLLEGIQKDEGHIKSLWNGLFHQPSTHSFNIPSKRFSSIMSTGASVLDGLILGWKLYRKFKYRR